MKKKKRDFPLSVVLSIYSFKKALFCTNFLSLARLRGCEISLFYIDN